MLVVDGSSKGFLDTGSTGLSTSGKIRADLNRELGTVGELERSGVEENWGVEGIEDKGDEKGEDFDDAAEPPGRGLNEKKIMPASVYKHPQNLLPLFLFKNSK